MRAKRPLPPERTAGEKLTAREAVWGWYTSSKLSTTAEMPGERG